MKEFDAIIIGSGQAGNPLAKALAKAGWKTALVEKDFIGGTCINTGCTPTKTMISSAKAAFMAAEGKKWGVEINDYKINIKTILNRKNEVVTRFRNGSYKALTETENIFVYFGTAAFVGNSKIEITRSTGARELITAKTIFINAGARPAIPLLAGLSETTYYTSSTILDLEEVPEHLIIIGGGYIGLELGQMYKRFGSNVTILEPAANVLQKEDDDVVKTITRFLQEENIRIVTQANVISVKEEGSKKLTVRVNVKGEEQTISGSHLLVAAGRTPNSDLLDLGTTGVELTEKGFIKVNDKLETSCAGIYALGDIKGGAQFTHIAYNDYLIVSKNILEKGQESTTDRVVPYCMFTDPQLGRVGITEAQARASGLSVKVATLPMSRVARGIESGQTHGLMKVIVDAQSSLLLGAAIVGEVGGEIMTILQMAMAGKITYQQLRVMVFAHPLYAESINNLFFELD